MAFVVEEDELSDVADIGLFRASAFVFHADDVAHLVESLRG